MGKAVRAASIVVVAVTAALGLAACGPPPASYVALGDSYTSGPVIAVQQNNEDIPGGCLQSTNNYPHLVAPGLDVDAFRDASCSGAETEDMTQEQGVDPGPNPPQFDRLDAETKVVSLGIGGNDIGFSSIAQECARRGVQDPQGSPCKTYYQSLPADQRPTAQIAALGPNLRTVLDGIDQRSPKAKVFVVGYPAILPETTDAFELCQPTLPVAKGDVPYLRDEIEKYLNAVIRFYTVAHGEVYVDTYGPSIGHDACQVPSVRWVEPVVPVADAAPVHPNRFGMEASARALRASLRANGVPVAG